MVPKLIFRHHHILTFFFFFSFFQQLVFKRLKLLQTSQNSFQLFSNSSRLVQTHPNSSKLVQTCPNLTNLSKLDKLVQTCPNSSKTCPKTYLPSNNLFWTIFHYRHHLSKAFWTIDYILLLYQLSFFNVPQTN